MTPVPERRTDPSGSLGLAAQPLAAPDRAPEVEFPHEEEDGDGRTARFEPLPDLPGGLVVRFSGTMEGSAGAWFSGLVLRRVEAGYIRLALDFAGLEWAPSPWIGHLTGILKAVKLRGGRLVLSGLPPKIEEAIRVLGFDQFFEIVDTEAEALTLLKRNPAGLEEPVFPKVFKCPICRARTRAAGPMRGRCKSCRTLLQVTDEGKVFLG